MTATLDSRWQNLLAQSAPTFAPDIAPPYGLTTRVLARMQAERRQGELIERIGWRALLASFALLLLAGIADLSGARSLNRGDLEPGLRALAQTFDLPLS